MKTFWLYLERKNNQLYKLYKNCELYKSSTNLSKCMLKIWRRSVKISMYIKVKIIYTDRTSDPYSIIPGTTPLNGFNIFTIKAIIFSMVMWYSTVTCCFWLVIRQCQHRARYPNQVHVTLELTLVSFRSKRSFNIACSDDRILI